MHIKVWNNLHFRNFHIGFHKCSFAEAINNHGLTNIHVSYLAAPVQTLQDVDLAVTNNTQFDNQQAVLWVDVFYNK